MKFIGCKIVNVVNDIQQDLFKIYYSWILKEWNKTFCEIFLETQGIFTDFGVISLFRFLFTDMKNRAHMEKVSVEIMKKFRRLRVRNGIELCWDMTEKYLKKPKIGLEYLIHPWDILRYAHYA